MVRGEVERDNRRMSDARGNPEFWTAVATISPLVLVAMAANMPELLSQNRKAQRDKPTGPLLERYINAWVVSTAVLGGLMTIGAASMLALRTTSTLTQTIAVIGLAGLMFGLFSGSWELWLLTRDLPSQPELLQAMLVRLPDPSPPAQPVPDDAAGRAQPG